MHKFDVLCKDKYMEGRLFVLHVEADDEQGALQAALDKFKNNDYRDYTPVAVARRNGEWGQWLKATKLPDPVKPHVTNTHYKG